MSCTNTITVSGPSGECYGFWVTVDKIIGIGGAFDRPHHGDAMAAVKTLYSGAQWTIAWADRDAGQYHPNVHMGSYDRGEAAPPRTRDQQRAMIMAIEREEILQDDLRAISRVVTPRSENKLAFGSRIRQLLVMACTEVEAQCKAILNANAYKGKAAALNMQDYVKIAVPLRLEQYVISCERFPDYAHFSPFAGWKTGTSLPWYRAYNETKHDADGKGIAATLEHAISAVGAVCTLILAQYGAPYIDETGSTPFFGLASVPLWLAHERNFPPPPSGGWTPMPYNF
jgi:hypothetical protein